MNRSYRGLSGRVLFAAAVCAAFSAAVAMSILISVLTKQALTRVAYLTPQLDPFLRQQCERDPTHFYRTLGADLELDFYEGTTLAPALPSMPPVDPELLARLRAGEEAPTRLYYFQFLGRKRGGAALRRVADRGPCSLVQIRWNVGRAERNRTWLLIFAIPVVSIAIAVALASFFAVRPLLMRLERLRRATQQVGQSSGYASAADPEADDVGQLSLLLDQAHARIAADAAEAARRQAELAQHLANVAHDLRTPLASLQLTIERLADSTELTIARLTDSSRTPDGELVRNAIDDVVYMGALIGNLYLACRLQDGADPLRGDPRVDLCALIEQVTRRFAKLGQARAIEVHGMRLDVPVWARCNAAMAEQVLQNLVHNAVSHGDEGGHVAVLLEATDHRFTLQVVDDGPGVPPAVLPRLGERTFRSDAARQRDPAGGGLGLAIASEVCRRANFTISFSREEPRGLRVTVTGERVEPPTSR
ncbi:MAG TPA: HAMP domain-containing sensor histidine kinase [Thauera aminoaromatica]|nr:HAMP domain-containing sensor histidine kinase [Thauera aminoaromatica]